MRINPINSIRSYYYNVFGGFKELIESVVSKIETADEQGSKRITLFVPEKYINRVMTVLNRADYKTEKLSDGVSLIVEWE